MIATGNWGACEWTISEEGALVIGAGAAQPVSADGTYPWDDYREQIRTISFGETVTGVVGLVGAFMNCSHLEEIDFRGLDTSNTVDLSWLLCGCHSLERVDLSVLDTSKVVDMSCMFLSCSRLSHVEMGSIDISAVMDMSKMFMYCSELKCLDMSGLDNRSLQMTEDMFFGCDGLRALVPGRDFSLGGGGRAVITMPEFSEETEAGDDSGAAEVKVSDWRTSEDGVLYIAGTDFSLRYDGNGATDTGDGVQPEDLSGQTCMAGTQLRAENPMFLPPGDLVFKEWNTLRDGSGRSIQPGQLFRVHADMVLYAIWAGTPAFTQVHDVPPVTYGQLLQLTQPEMDPRFGQITSLQVQISKAQGCGWEEFRNDVPLPASRSGARIRYVAENFVGQSASEEKVITIEKASYDMSRAHWVLPEDLTYTGEEKQVRLEGLPQGVAAEYIGNTAVNVGQYTARAVLNYDEENYQPPQPVEDLTWTITKGRYQMKDLNWTYMEAFTYDGQPKSVRLEGLPEGTVPYYAGADAVDAGTYVATAGLDYDIDNYSSPDPVMPCTWKILKTTHDMSDVHWEGTGEFVYDGNPKKVELSGLPQGVRAEYTGNVAVDAGDYIARAVFVLEDPVNYEIPEPVSFDWKICKADHNVDDMAWTDVQLVYNGEEQHVRLVGIPEGVSVLYDGDTGTEAGDYVVRAEFFVEDLNNYNQMDSITTPWQIRKADIDFSRTRWNYSSPYIYNGSEKTVELRNLPDQIREVTYTGDRGVDAGNYTARAFFTYDEANYNPPLMESCIWTILKANLKLQDARWDYQAPITYDGLEHEVKVVGLPDNATVTYEDNRGTYAGQYESRARILPADPANYNTPAPMKLSWQIRKAVFDISQGSWDLDQKRVYDGGSKSVRIQGLPEGIRVSYEGNEAAEAGQYLAKAVFAVEDTDNFVAPAPEEIRWNIDPADIDLTGVCWDYSQPFVYDGSEKQIRLTGLPEGVTARYEGNVASDAGEYAAQAELIPPEGSSFRPTRVLGKVWRIDKAEIDVSHLCWALPEDPVYDGMMKQVSLRHVPDSLHVEYSGNEAAQAGSYRAEAILTPYDERNFHPPRVSGCSWQIERADIDMSQVHWSGYETFTYDGTVHRVLLQDLPPTVEAIYEGNGAVDAGNYIAIADFRPLDQRNYNTPRRMQYEWSVARAQIRAENAYWTSGGDDLVYDGQPHSIRLAGLPEGVEPTYQGNTAVDSGQYIASAVLEPADHGNYLPCVLPPYRWEIEKAEIDISNVMWASSGELVYDGSLKVVGLTGLSDDVSVEYENNVAVEAGTYHASAILSTQNNNYVAPEIEGCTWTIAKAVPDMSGVTWSYAFEFTYDGYEKSVELLDLPPGVTASYTGNAGIEAGEYLAEAVLTVSDAMNYEAPVVEPLRWRIGKRDYDLTAAAWTGAEGLVYDGSLKVVELTGLEEGLEPIYEGNAATEAGVYTATARFLYDENNYNPPRELSLTWEIHKAPMDTSGVRWDYEGPLKAGRNRTVTLKAEGGEKGVMGRMLGKNKEVKYLGLPEGTTVRYEGNTGRQAGTYEAKAYFTAPPQPNYEATGSVCLTWEIIDD